MRQVGAFPHYGGRWAEWNGNFRDTVRSFIKGSEGPWAQAFASAVCGSPTIYAAEQPGEWYALLSFSKAVAGHLEWQCTRLARRWHEARAKHIA